MAKYLIVNADDYGLCPAANEAVEALFEAGRLYSASIMMPARSAEDAVRFAIDHPQYAIGVHLTLTCEWDKYRWGPLTQGKSLVYPDGTMLRTTVEVEKNVDMREYEAEIRAQVDRAHAMGMHPSHLDNHMGTMYGNRTGRFSLLKTALRICGDYGYPFRMFRSTDRRLCPAGVPYAVFRCLPLFSRAWSRRYGVTLPDFMLFPDWTKDLMQSYGHYRETILRLWTDLPDGVTETFVHPCVESEDMKSFIRYWPTRVWEYTLLNDPETHRYLADHGVQMISYRDLTEMRRT